MNKSSISFGTDGWRGIIDRDINNKTVAEAAQAFADYLHASTSVKANLKIAIGYDGRTHSKPWALLFARVLSGNNIEVLLSDKIVPTPLLSWFTKSKNLDAGVMITASHNPPEYNGVKIKGAYGGPLFPEETLKLELHLGNNLVQADEDKINFKDFRQDYYDHISEFIDFEAIKDSGINVLVDSMGGSCQQLIENIFGRFEIQCKTISKISDKDFGGRIAEPIEKNLNPLRAELLKGIYAAGFATDGDGDRLGVMTDKGEYISSQEIILLLADYLVNQRNYSGDIIKTYSVTDKVRLLFSNAERKVIDVPVGYRYICEKMIANDIAFGCEESGGYSFKNHMPDRDGIISALMITEMIAKSGYRTLSDLINEKRKIWGNIYFKRKDFSYNKSDKLERIKSLVNEPMDNIKGYKVLSTHVFYNEREILNGIKFMLEGQTRWILIRSSETEPLIRIYAEGESSEEVDELITFGEDFFQID